MRGSLTLRLVAGVVLAQLLLALGLVWAGLIFTRRQLRNAFDAALRGQLLSVAALVRYPETGTALVFDRGLMPPPNASHPDFYMVRDASAHTVVSSFPAPIALPPPGAADGRYWSFHYAGVAYRGLRLDRLPIRDSEEDIPGPPALLTVFYAAPVLGVGAKVTVAGVAIAATSLVLLLLTSLLAAWAIRRELGPLRELAHRAAAISPSNWEFHPSQGARQEGVGSPPPELAPLIQALQRMLGRLHASHQQQREFMADAAHHLKTPVAILKSTLQSLLRRPRPVEEYHAAVQASLLDVERLEQLLQRMLRLARLEQAIDTQVQPGAAPPLADLTASCQAALEQVQPLAQHRGVELRSEGLDQPRWLRADADDLQLIWVNLLENAVQHSPPGAPVELYCSAAAGQLRVEVRDRGAGIAPEEALHVFERFRRGANTPPGGFGLGLAIARAIAQAYQGAIEVSSGGASVGATFAVTLPAAGVAAGPRGGARR